MSLVLGGLLLTRPEPAVRIEIVRMPAVETPKPRPSTEPTEPPLSTESPMPEWRLQHHHVSLRSEPISDPSDDASRGTPDSRPFGVADILKGPLVWSSISNVGER
jgi:hypothetical protein